MTPTPPVLVAGRVEYEEVHNKDDVVTNAAVLSLPRRDHRRLRQHNGFNEASFKTFKEKMMEEKKRKEKRAALVKEKAVAMREGKPAMRRHAAPLTRSSRHIAREIKYRFDHGLNLDDELTNDLFIFSKLGVLPVTKVLIAQGAIDIRANPCYRTLLHAVVRKDYPGTLSMVNFLLEQGVHVYAQDQYGRTALHYAAMNGYDDIVQRLMEEDPGIFMCQDKDNKTAYLLAAEYGYDTTAEVAFELYDQWVDPNTIRCQGEDGHCDDDDDEVSSFKKRMKAAAQRKCQRVVLREKAARREERCHVAHDQHIFR